MNVTEAVMYSTESKAHKSEFKNVSIYRSSKANSSVSAVACSGEFSSHAVCKRPRGCIVNCGRDTTTAAQQPPSTSVKGSVPEEKVRSGGEVRAINMAPVAPDPSTTTGAMSFFPSRQPRRRYLLTFMLVLGIVGAIVLVTPICILCLKVHCVYALIEKVHISK